MKKLPLPNVDFPTALATAISGIGDDAERAAHTAAFPDPAAVASRYEAAAIAVNLYAEPRVDASLDPIIIGALRKSHLTKLYSQYFVPEKKPARRLYEKLKVTANGKCPLCSGIGHVRTLDHYLPKANFPIYSVMPTNLVPCCRDCNSEKLNAFANLKYKQTLHPYFDHSRFFDDKWVYARVIQQTPPVLEYFVSPPEHWCDEDKYRAQSHFIEYNLAEKFSVEAAADIPETVQIRRTIMSNISPIEFSDYLYEKANTPNIPINNWRRVMFSALAENLWFCQQTFEELF